MFFNPNATYDQAISDRDVGVLKALLVGIIGSDPTFVTEEFEEAQDYIRTKSKEIHGEEIKLNEDYKRREDEYECEESEWDERYFQLNLVWLRDNFALSERLPKIKKIGKYVYKDKQTLGKLKDKNKNKQQSTSMEIHNNDNRTEEKKNSIVRTNGDDYKGERLSSGFSKWIKSNWYWMLLTFAIIVLILIIFGITGRNNDSFEKGSDTIEMHGADIEMNKNEFIEETFCFVLDQNIDELVIYEGGIVYDWE